MKSKKLSRVILTVFVLGWMTLIFMFSAQNGANSADTSNGFIKLLVSVIYPNFESLTASAQSAIIKSMALPVRKAAHFSVFFILGALLFYWYKSFHAIKTVLSAFLAFISGSVYAATDEIHQYYVPGRACTFTDFCIDSMGVLLAVILFAVIYSLSNRRKRKMRKKELIKQNLLLVEQLQETHAQIHELKEQLNSSERQIAELKAATQEKTEEKPQIEEETVKNTADRSASIELKPEVQYGSKIIGEIVVSAAQYSNKLTVGGDTANRELVNLILGKTEVAKSEILTIVSADDGFEVKKAKIDTVAATAREYFEGVMAQLN